MRILTFTETAFGLGAHSRHKEMVRGLLRAGHQVIWLGPSRADTVELAGVNFQQLRVPGLLKLSIPGFALCYALNLIYLAFRHGPFDAAFVIRERELLVLWLLRFISPGASLLFFQRAAVIEKLRFNLSDIHPPLRRLKQRLQLGFWRAMGRLLYCIPDKIIVQTPGHGIAIAGRRSGIRDALIVLPNSIRASWMSNEGHDVRSLVEIPPSAKIIGYVGNIFIYGKGLDLMLRAFRLLAEHSDVVLVIFGNGPDLERMKALSSELNVEQRVRILGRVDGAMRYMASLDALMHLSRIDDCPNVVLEALQCGVPLIATRIPAHEFMLGEQFSGLAEVDEEAIARVAAAVLYDAEFRKRVLAQQLERVMLFDFDWCDEVVKIFENRVAEEPGGARHSDVAGMVWKARPLSSLSISTNN